MKQSVLFDYEPQQLEGEMGSTVRVEGEAEGQDEATSLSWEEVRSLRWSLWISSFAVINLLLFSFLQSFVQPDGMAGDASLVATGMAGKILSVVLILLVLSGISVLWKEWVRGSSTEKYSYGAGLTLLALATTLTLLSMKQVVLEGLVADSSVWMIHHSVWGLFCAAWFIALSEQLHLAVRGIDTLRGVWRRSPHLNRDDHIQAIDYGVLAEALTEEPALREGQGLRLTEGHVAPCSMRVSRGLCLVRPRSGGRSETPLLRQSGDELLAGSLLIKGTIEAVALGSEERDPAREWVRAQGAHCLKSDDAYVASSFRLTQIVLFGVTAVSLLVLGSSLFGLSLPMFFLATPVALSPSSVTSIIENEPYLVLYLLGITPVVELMLAWRGLQNGFLRRFFESEIVVRDFRIFEGLRKVQTVVFRIGSRSPLIGSAGVREFQLIDQRVDLSRLYGVVFGILRNTEDPSFVAVREYCFDRTSKPELFRIEEEVNDKGLVGGVVQGAHFMIGTEAALLERGIHLEVSEAFYEQAEFMTRLYVAVGNEVVGSFIVEPPFFSEMPKIAHTLRRQHVRPILEGIDVDPGELDELGDMLGFELVDIRAFSDGGPSRENGLQSDTTLDDTLYVLLSPEEGGLDSNVEHEERESRLMMTWFRETLWNVSFPGILLVTRRLSPVTRLIALSKLFYWMRNGVMWCSILLVVGGVLGGGLRVVGLTQVMLIMAGAVLLLLGVLQYVVHRMSPNPNRV